MATSVSVFMQNYWQDGSHKTIPMNYELLIFFCPNIVDNYYVSMEVWQSCAYIAFIIALSNKPNYLRKKFQFFVVFD